VGDGGRVVCALGVVGLWACGLVGVVTWGGGVYGLWGGVRCAWGFWEELIGGLGGGGGQRFLRWG